MLGNGSCVDDGGKGNMTCLYTATELPSHSVCTWEWDDRQDPFHSV